MRCWICVLPLLAAVGVAAPSGATMIIDRADSGLAVTIDYRDTLGDGLTKDALASLRPNALDPAAQELPDSYAFDEMGLSLAPTDLDGFASLFAPIMPAIKGRKAAGIGSIIGLGGEVSAAPEPSAWMMLVIGFGVIGSILRRRDTIPSLGHAQIV